jgi:hypothetical protein
MRVLPHISCPSMLSSLAIRSICRSN